MHRYRMKRKRIWRAYAGSYMTAICLCLSFLFCAPHYAGSDYRDKRKNLGIFGESRKESVLGQDGCTPIPLDKGVMWTFGDTILGSWKGDLSVDSTFEDSAVIKGM